MRDTGGWLSKGVFNPSPASLEDLIFCWSLLSPFQGSLSLMVSGQGILGQVLMNLLIFCIVVTVVLPVLAP